MSFSLQAAAMYNFCGYGLKQGNRSLRLDFAAIVEGGMAIDYMIVNCQNEFCF